MAVVELEVEVGLDEEEDVMGVGEVDFRGGVGVAEEWDLGMVLVVKGRD